jgi:hypothetical protein
MITAETLAAASRVNAHAALRAMPTGCDRNQAEVEPHDVVRPDAQSLPIETPTAADRGADGVVLAS